MGARSIVFGSLVVFVGCAGETRAPQAPISHVESLWDLSPRDASAGVVFADGVPEKIFALMDGVHEGAFRKRLEEGAKKRGVEPLPTRAGWADAGLDASLGFGGFSWPDKKRGALVILPVRDRVKFAAAFHLETRTIGGRLYETNGDYLCKPIAGRYVCALRAEDIDESAAPHTSPLATAFRALGPEDRGDISLYGDVHNREIARLAEQAKLAGRIRGVAVQVRVRDDGATARVHVIADELTPLAHAFRGTRPPAAFQPPATGAPTLVRLAFDPRNALPPNAPMDPLFRTELYERLSGQLEMTTSGRGLFGVYAVAPLDQGARVEAFVKTKCAEQGGSKLEYLLRDITVTEHGCTARFDPRMLLLPVHMEPLPVAALVDHGKLVITAGDASAPTAADRAQGFVAPESSAPAAFGDTQAVVAFTRSPWIGPDTDAGAAFKSVVSMLDEKTTTGIDAFDDLGAHIAQAVMAGRMTDDGLIVDAEFTTFARDPAPARAAYDEALAQRSAGDAAAYRTKLADVERRFPGTMVAQRAKDVREGGPWLGAGATFLSWLGSARKPK